MVNFQIGDQVEYIGPSYHLENWKRLYPIFVREIDNEFIHLTTNDPFAPYQANKSYSNMNPKYWQVVNDLDSELREALSKWRKVLDV